MTQTVHRSALLELALLLCPRSFREEYREQIYSHAEETGRTGAAAIDVARYGIGVRLEGLARDIVLALRGLMKARMFSAVSVVTLALAISVNAAVFAIVQAVLLQPLPFVQPERLVFLCPGAPPSCTNQFPSGITGRYQREAGGLRGVAAFQFGSATLLGVGLPQSLRTGMVSTNVLDVLGTPVQLGRSFTRADGEPGVRDALISERLWRRTFGGDPHAVGKTVRLDDAQWRIVGVVPAGVYLPTPGIDSPKQMELDLWVPLANATFAQPAQEMNNWNFARLAPGTTPAAADAEIKRVTAEMVRERPIDERGLSVAAVPFGSWYNSKIRVFLMLMAAAALAVLLIACANVANLLLARMVTRRGELALRSALGASRGRIVRELLIEIALVALAGGALGLLLAAAELRVLVATTVNQLPAVAASGLNAGVVLFTFAVVAAATLLSGIVPALSATGGDLAGSLKSIGRGADGGRVKAVRTTLAVIEIALAFGVVAVSGLFVRSSVALAAAPLGVDPHGVYLAQVALNADRYRNDAARAAFARAVTDRVAALPGVEAVAVARHGHYSSNGVELGGFRLPERTYRGTAAENAPATQIGPDYFRALRLPLVRGRSFTASDDARAPRVAIVDETIARTVFGGRDPVGARILVDQAGTYLPVTIVGEARAATPYGYAEEPRLYLANAQFPASFPEVVIRMHTPDPTLREHVATAIAQTDPDLALVSFASAEARATAGTARLATSATLLAVLALVALLLALIGIYAIVSYSVEQRRHEFGIRIAVGARAADILRAVLGGALRIAVLGIACGVVLAALGTSSLDRLLYAVSTADPVTFGVVAALVLICVALATAVPAARAMRADPAVALRYE